MDNQGKLPAAAPVVIQMNPQRAVYQTESEMADAWVRTHGARYRYDATRLRWYIWSDGLWEADKTGLTLWDIGRFCVEHDNPKSQKFGSQRAIHAVEKLARVNPEVALTASQWDQHPNVLATPGVYIDLGTDERFEPDPSLLLTQKTRVKPESGTPTRWLDFLDDATGHDADYIQFIRRALFYCLTGRIHEHVLFFVLGLSGSGKGTLFETVLAIAGDYGITIDPGIFKLKHEDGHPTEIARLKGARFVLCSELPKGITWDASKLKRLTGGDTLAARFMRGDWFSFVPTHKLVVLSNHEPKVESGEEGIERRMIVCPFDNARRREERDTDLPEKLVPEHGRILNWILAGGVAYRQQGLHPPRVVDEATRRYLDDLDLIGQWVNHCLVISKDDDFVTNERLASSLTDFARGWGEDVPESAHAIGHALRNVAKKKGLPIASGVRRISGSVKRGWTGVRIRP